MTDILMEPEPISLDVAACVAQVRHGDEDAARDLFRHLHPLVCKIVRSHLPRRTAEEDLIQQVFAKIFSKLDQFQGNVPLEHWVSRVAVNTCLNQLQKEKIRPELRFADLSEEEETVVMDLAHTPAELGSEQGLAARDLVERLLQDLSPDFRLVVTLLHMEGKSVEEVRQLTGWSAALIKIRAFRARLKMKARLKKLAPDLQL